MPVDTVRHTSVFSSQEFNSANSITVIGCGATGSRVVLGLAKLGIENITVYDGDVVEQHNIANQAFGSKHIGMPKAEAIASIVKEYVDVEITAKPEFLTEDTEEDLGNYVFLLTDTMKSRKEIWESHVKFKSHISGMIETRMGVMEGHVYCVNPLDPEETEAWENTLVDDDDTTESACGASISVGPTAEALSGIAQVQLVRYHNWVQQKEGYREKPQFSFSYYLNPVTVIVDGDIWGKL